MFNRKTLFVVGAGGSKELGLPIGDELKGKIAERVNISFSDGYNRSSGDRDVYRAVQNRLRELGESNGNPYWAAGRSIAAAMPQALSIDNYLDAHSTDRYIVDMGKIGIVSSILEAERQSILYDDWRTGARHNFKKTANTWHNTFCKILTEGVRREDLDSLFQNVSFITFNYDRCIEHYIALWLESYYRIEATEAQNLVKTMPIVHPYGRIGPLPWQTNQLPVPYGADPQEHDLSVLAKNIRTFTEQVDDETVPEKMKELVAEAHQIVYLGFSFGSQNMDLLKPENCHIYKKAYGTTLGLSGPNIQVIRNRLTNDLVIHSQVFMTSIDFSGSTCQNLLEDYSRVLTA